MDEIELMPVTVRQFFTIIYAWNVNGPYQDKLNIYAAT